MSISAKMKEDEIIEHHLGIALHGFEALKRVITFCCCGCGLCISVCPSSSLIFDDEKKRPQLVGKCNRCGFCFLACPRSFLPLTRITHTFYAGGGDEEHRRLGAFQSGYVARSLTESIYRAGTPGGTTTAIVHFLMDQGYIDAALLTRGRHAEVEYCMHPEPYIATTAGEVLLSSRSKFEISPVLSMLRKLSHYGKTLIVGTPCHIVALRKLQMIAADHIFAETMRELSQLARELTSRISFALSINCFLNHSGMDRVYQWLEVEEKDIVRFNENISKDLLEKALAEGKNWKWVLRNCVVTRDGKEKEYDLMQLGVLALHSGCLVCTDAITSTCADASIGFFGGETGVHDFGWNTLVILSPELNAIVDAIVEHKKLDRKPLLRGYGRTLRRLLEWSMQRCMPPLDVMGVTHYLKTGQWKYPHLLRRVKGPRQGNYIMGLELFFLAQTLRRELFYPGAVKALGKAGAYLPTVY